MNHPLRMTAPTLPLSPPAEPAWRRLWQREPRLVAFAAVMLALMIPAAFGLWLDERTLRDVNVWVKPMKFMLSVAVTALTTAWFVPLLPEAVRRGRAFGLLVWTVIVTGGFEVAYITVQAALGQASHYNVGDPFHALMYTLMGIGAVVLTATQPWLAWMIWRHGQPGVAPAYRLGVLLDLAHLNEAGFWDVAKISTKPLVSTHSAAHALTPATRNLTDKQLDAMAERGGLVGLNFGCAFVRPDGVKNPDTAPSVLIRHLDHLLDRLGEGGVALGSDFDGTMIPAFLRDAAGLPRLVQAMRDAGYGETLIRRICWDNWMGVLGRIIG